MNLLPIAQRLEAQGQGTQGSTIFLNHFPAEAPLGLLVRPRLIGAKLDYYLPGYIKFQFQLIARARTYAEANTLAVNATKALRMDGGTLDTWKVNYIRALHVPVGYPITIGELVELNADFEACIVDPLWV